MKDLKNMCMEMMKRRISYGMPMGMPTSFHHESMNVDKFVELMSDFWCEVNAGTRQIPTGMAEGICTMVNAMLDVRMAGNDVCAEAITAHELHGKYHDAVDKIRSVNSVSEKTRLVNEHFTGLTDAERKVLMYKVNMKPKATVARELGMSMDAYCEAKNNLMHKLKH